MASHEYVYAYNDTSPVEDTTENKTLYDIIY